MKKPPEEGLEQFWLELSESFVDLDKLNLFPTFSSLPDFVGKLLKPSAYSYFYDLPTDSSGQKKNYSSPPALEANERVIRMKQLRSSTARLFLEMMKCLNRDGDRKTL
jgi:hypothetical protein